MIVKEGIEKLITIQSSQIKKNHFRHLFCGNYMKPSLKIPSISMLPLPDKDVLLFKKMDETNFLNPILSNFPQLDPSIQSTSNQAPSDKQYVTEQNFGQKTPSTKKKKEDKRKKEEEAMYYKKTKFEQWEDLLIVKERTRIGNHWSKIANKLPGRSPSAIKNRWYSVLRNKFPTEAMIGQKERSETNLCGYASD